MKALTTRVNFSSSTRSESLSREIFLGFITADDGKPATIWLTLSNVFTGTFVAMVIFDFLRDVPSNASCEFVGRVGRLRIAAPAALDITLLSIESDVVTIVYVFPSITTFLVDMPRAAIAAPAWGVSWLWCGVVNSD